MSRRRRQIPWIRNCSLRDNITCFSERPSSAAADMEWYRQVLHACCLDEDIAAMPAGDATEIGENGINLSGGQRARCGLARALYSRATFLLLDDVTRCERAACSTRPACVCGRRFIRILPRSFRLCCVCAVCRVAACAVNEAVLWTLW